MENQDKNTPYYRSCQKTVKQITKRNENNITTNKRRVKKSRRKI